MPLSPELADLLAAALRERPSTVDALATLSGITTDDAHRHLATLEHLGYLDTSDDTITYRRPESPAAELAHRTLTDALARLRDATEDVDAVLGSLPALLRAWDTGADDQVIRIDASTGTNAATEAWMHHIARDTPVSCDICLPDMTALLNSDRPESVADWLAEVIGTLRIRLIISEADARTPALSRVADRLARGGAEVRTHPRPPSFCWASNTGVVGIPARWGTAWPTTVLAVRSPAITTLVMAAFGQAWRAASPLGGHDSAHTPGRGWDSMLTLLGDGMTVESAGVRLGLAPRTARRRVAAAMQYYGVSSQFGLGAAWGRDRSRPGDIR